jgi:hypothetical protein
MANYPPKHTIEDVIEFVKDKAHRVCWECEMEESGAYLPGTHNMNGEFEVPPYTRSSVVKHTITIEVLEIVEG